MKSLAGVTVIILIFAVAANGQSKTPLLKFEALKQEKQEEIVVEDHIVKVNEFDPPADVNDVTVCVRFQVDILVEQFVFSVKEKKNFLMLMIKDIKNGIMFYGLNGKTYMLLIPEEMSILPAIWNHLCIAYKSGTLSPVMNGRLLHDDLTDLPGLGLTGSDFEGKTLVLGYDHFGNQNNQLQRNLFHGSISEFYVFHDGLTIENMVAITKDCSKASEFSSKFIFNWDAAFSDRDKVVRDQVICQSSGSGQDMQSVLFPYQANNLDAFPTCEGFGGHILSPSGRQEGEEIVNKYSGDGLLSSTCSMFILAGIIQGDSSRHWIDVVTNSTPAFNVYWQPGQPNGRHLDKCSRFSLREMSYYDIGCDRASAKECFMCKLKPNNVFHLRGLSEDIQDIADSQYSTNVDLPDGMIELRGFLKSKVKWFHDIKQWRILPLFGDIQKNINLETENPLGKRLWDINGQQVSLKLTQCGRKQFSCHDAGTCLPMSQRCDGNKDCRDGSDEEDCYLKSIPTSYKIAKPPKGPVSTEPLPIILDLEIMKIASVEEINLEFTAVLKITLTWFDKRIDFINLKEDPLSNMMTGSSMNEIWLPMVKFSNSIALEPEVAEGDDYTVVHRMEQPSVNDLSHLDEELLYKGSQNPISLVKTFKVNLACEFNLAMFPFDKQSCPIKVRPIISNEALVKIILNNTAYHGPKILLQYDILEVVRGNQTDVPDDKEVSAIINLKRIINYHLAITFLPSLCLIIIAELTLYIDSRHFEATIMVALTSMLVMYTLYQSVSYSLPQTPYLKMIDIWLLAGLLIPFIVFIFLICLEILISSPGRNRIMSMTNSSFEELKNQSNRKEAVVKLIKKFFIIGTVLFVVIYWIVAVAHFFEI